MTTRCPTCGEELESGDRRCPTCGTEPARLRDLPLRIRRCPRCGYRGEGIGYFRRPGHVAILVVLALFTYGIGGLVYWLIRRNGRVCPRCGLGWEHASRTVPAGSGDRPVRSASEEEAAEVAGEVLDLPSGGLKRRVLGVVGILAAALLISLGLVEGNLPGIAVGGVVGVGGAMTFWWGWRALQDRRNAVVSSLQRRVLLLASRRGGTLTVTEVAAELDLSLEAAEKVLISMDDGFRVRSEITREGLLLYEFPEIQHRASLEEGGSPGS